VLSQFKKAIAVVSSVGLAVSLMTFMGSTATATGSKTSIEVNGFSKHNRYIVSGNAATKNFIAAKFAGDSKSFFGNHSVVFAKKGEIVSALRSAKFDLGKVKIYPDQFIETPRTDMLTGRPLGNTVSANELEEIMDELVFDQPDTDPTGDSYSILQWSLWPNYDWGWAPHFYGVNAYAAFDVLDGMEVGAGEDVNVSIIDTGYTLHPELDIADSADFVSEDAGNDGDDWDNDGADPGDWCDDGDPETLDTSSWHGTHVHGTIAADRGPGLISGVAPDANVVHARALGTCGGYRSDIVAAMLWSAGFDFTDYGIADNEYPADIINMSLGGSGICDPLYDEALAYLRGITDTLVIVSAGNGYDPAAGASPAGCETAVTVASSGSSGDRAYYSNYGVNVDLTAPGGDWCDTAYSQWLAGDFENCQDSVDYFESLDMYPYYYVDFNMILSTLNYGLTTPDYSDPGYAWYQGTSMAAPHVAGVAALALSANPDLNADQLEEVLTGSTADFGNHAYEEYYVEMLRGLDDYSCNLHVYMCGTGIVNAYNAVQLALATEGTDGSRVSRVQINVGGNLTKGTATVKFFLPVDLNLWEDLSYVDVAIKLRGATNVTKCRANPDSIGWWNEYMSCSFKSLSHGRTYDVTITPVYGRVKGEVVTRSFTTVHLPVSAWFTSVRVLEWDDIYYGIYDGIASLSWNKPKVPALSNAPGDHLDDPYFQVEAYSEAAGEMWNLCSTYSTSCAIPFMIPGDRVKFRIITMTSRGTVISKWTKWYRVPGTFPVG